MQGAAATKTRNSPTFGSFALLAKLARGDIGDLFLARSQGAGGFEKLVIIKRIHAQLMKDPQIADLFMEEARTAAQIEHPNVRIVYEIGRATTHYYIALEYLEGVPLVDVLLARRREKRLADSRLIAALLSQACQGLHVAHTLRGGELIHGDINPRSIFVTATGTAKILDFDIVEMRGALAERHGFVRRTSAYMSPEEVRTGRCDLRGDIFSMGVVAWEALTGRRLFKQETRDRTLQAIDRGRIPNANQYRPNLSDALNATVMRALNRDPTLRFQSARDFGSALDRASQAEGPPLTPVNIASLIESSFAASLKQQREFVRAARSGNGAPLTAPHQAIEENAIPVGAAEAGDPDDWSSDTDAATRVAPNMGILAASSRNEPNAENFGAQIQDPFFEISESVNYSEVSEVPAFQDTRNLVLSELGAGAPELLGEDEETGAVEIGPPSDYELDSYGYSSNDLGAPPLQEPPGYDERLPRMPSTIDPDAPVKSSSRGLSTIDPEAKSSSFPPPPSDAMGIGDRLNTLAPENSVDYESLVDGPEDRSPSRGGSGAGRLLFLLLLLAGTAAAAAHFGLGIGKKEAPENALAPASETVETAAIPEGKQSSGAGAAASILAAANAEGLGGEAGSSEEEATAANERGDLAPDLSALDEAEERDGGPAPDTGTDTTASESPEASAEKAQASAAQKQERARVEQEAMQRSERARNEAERQETKRTEKERTEKERADLRRKQREAAKAKPPKREPKEKRDAKQVRSAGGMGFLTINATPYATVFVDGKKRGITPLVNLKLKSGNHRIKLVSSADGKAKTMNLKILSDEVVRRNVSF